MLYQIKKKNYTLEELADKIEPSLWEIRLIRRLKIGDSIALINKSIDLKIERVK